MVNRGYINPDNFDWINSNKVDDIKLPRGYAMFTEQTPRGYFRGYGSYPLQPDRGIGLPSYRALKYGSLASPLSDIMLQGQVTKNVTPEGIKEGLDVIYGNKGRKIGGVDLSDVKDTTKNVTKGTSSLGAILKKNAPGIGDVYDITHGYEKIRYPNNAFDPFIGAGQLGMGILGLGSLAAAPFTGGGSVAIKTGAKVTAKKILQGIGKAISKGNYKKATNRLAQLLHSDWRGKELLAGGLYDIYNFFNKDWGKNYTPQEDNDNSKVEDNVGEAEEMAANGYEPSQYEPIDVSDIDVAKAYDELRSMFDAEAPRDVPTEQLDFSNTQPKYNKEGMPTNIAGINEILSKSGWQPEEITGLLNGLNNGRPDVRDFIDRYNEVAEDGQNIKIPTTPEEIANARILSGYIDNTGDNNTPQNDVAYQQDPEELNKVLDFYNNLRDNYKDYIDYLEKLRDRYSDREWLEYKLRMGDAYPSGLDSINEGLIKKAGLYKTIADTKTDYDKALLQAQGNYDLYKSLGLPVNANFADNDIVKAYLTNKNKNTELLQKLAIELLKLQNAKEEGAANRANRYDIASMQVKAANDRATLQRKLDQQKLAFEIAKVNGNRQLQAQIRDSINKTNIMINATRIVGEAGIYGVENPKALVEAMKILGYTLPDNIADTDIDILNRLESYEQNQ